MSASVVMVSPGFPPGVGGAERQALELSKELLARGVRVRVLTRRLGGLPAEGEVEGVPVRRLPAWGAGLCGSAVFLTAVFLWLLLRARSYGAVHVHLAGSPAVAAALAGRLLGKRVVVKVGGGRGIGEIAVSSRSTAGRLKLRLLGLLKPRFTAVSADLVAEMSERGMDVSGARVIPNGVDVARHRPRSAAEKSGARRALGWAEGVWVLYAGRLSPEKQLPVFLRAFAKARLECSVPARLALAGEGPEEAALREAARRLELGDAFRMLPPRGDVETLYAAADVFALPSHSEGLSNALLEAMASGLAVMAGRVGGARDAVEHEASGLLFDPLDFDDMVGALRRLLGDEPLRARLGAAAARRAAERYSISAVAARYFELYT